ncbi:MAG: AMMECR1 domain-containing protein [Candidatus Moranbacteria bacterium]|nr:AMMECR1 domain-containing protein [Candidatus Moranbacteria bacterium]MBP9801497.1 AMMECR1 domain-containing protein [Candidatus Moranbacteria bacterium]
MWGIDFTQWRKKHTRIEKPSVFVEQQRLNSRDQQRMFAFVRTILKSSNQCLNEREKTTADIALSDDNRLVTLSVAFWIGGILRGCSVLYQEPLKEALRQAAFQATHDSRFKPVREEELADARIEITLLTPWKTMSVHQLRRQKDIDAEKCYRIFFQNQQGWLLPGVFNCLRFQNTDDFLRTLITEKAGLRIDRQFLKEAKIEIFQGEDFIESEAGRRILSLSGPIVRQNQQYTSFDKQCIGDLTTLLHRSAAQLLRIQEGDGNIPSIIDPLSGKMRQIDWVRLAFSATALVAFGKVSKTEEYFVAAEKIGRYIWKYGYNHPSLDIYTKTLCRVYYGEYLWFAGRMDEAKSTAWEVLRHEESIRFEPIFLLKLASFLLLFRENDFLKRSEAIFELVWSNFLEKRKSGESIELAQFPELIVVAEKLFTITREPQYQEKGVEITSWLIKQQQADGSFPSTTARILSCTRGTGKIFEVFALHPRENCASILRTFEWLQNMQYNEENTFFVKPEHREKILGGFRHDVFNQEVWIDSSAHVLLGGARILEGLKQER